MIVRNIEPYPPAKKNPSVLHVIAGARTGGAETFALDAILALDALGVRQRVICRPHDAYIQALQSRGIAFDVLDFSFIDRLGRGTERIRRTCATFGPDVVHAWMGRAASFIPKALNVPVVGWFGGYYDLKRYQTCDYYIGITKAVADHIIRQSGRPQRTFLIPTFGTLPPSAPVERETLKTPPDVPVVLLLSRMHQKKGIDTLLKAAVRLPGVYFWLAGDGPGKQEYEALTATLGLGDRVRFLGWRQDRAALLQAADVCVLPSRYEPFGTVMAEAWAMKTPLVAAKADGARQYVRHGENGLLCEIDDSDGLAAQIGRVISDENICRTIVDGGFATYQSTFDKNVVTRSLADAYAIMTGVGKDRSFRPLDDEFAQEITLPNLVAQAHESEDFASLDASAGVAFDVGMLQQERRYDFLRRNWRGKPTACEIWRVEECDLAMENLARQSTRS